MQGGHKPSHFMAKSNLHELEEHKAHLPVVISEQGCTHGCFLGPNNSPVAPGSLGGGKTEQVSGMGSAVSRVSLPGAELCPQWCQPRGLTGDAIIMSPVSTQPRGTGCLALGQVSSQAA